MGILGFAEHGPQCVPERTLFVDDAQPCGQLQKLFGKVAATRWPHGEKVPECVLLRLCVLRRLGVDHIRAARPGDGRRDDLGPRLERPFDATGLRTPSDEKRAQEGERRDDEPAAFLAHPRPKIGVAEARTRLRVLLLWLQAGDEHAPGRVPAIGDVVSGEKGHGDPRFRLDCGLSEDAELHLVAGGQDLVDRRAPEWSGDVVEAEQAGRVESVRPS
ncbi:MAG TPA: hypothetical protein VGM06_10950 [Polyangiaceae bacterium]|jgi:hypothetical protein